MSRQVGRLVLGSLLLAAVSCGCGGGAGSGAGSAPGLTATSGTLSVRIGAPVQSRLAFDTASITITVLDPVTKSPVVPPVVSAPNSTATVLGVPLGPHLVLARAFSAGGTLLTQGSQTVDVVPGNGNQAIITTDFVPMFVYTSNTVSQTVEGFEFDPLTGALSPIQGVSLAVTGAFTLAVDKSGTFLYVVDRVDEALQVLSIDPATGALTALPALTQSIPNDPTNTVGLIEFPQITPDNRFLYMTSATPNNTFASGFTNALVNGFQRNLQTGALTPVPGSPFDASPGVFAVNREGPRPGDVEIDPSGRFVDLVLGGQLGNGTNEDLLSTFAIDPNSGSLSFVTNGQAVLNINPVLFIGGPALNPKANFTYVFSGPAGPVTAGLVSPRDASTLLQNNGTPFTLQGGTNPEFQFDPTGQVMFAPDLDNNTIDQYSLDPTTGFPTFIGALPTAPSPGVVVFDPTQSFALVSCRGTQGNNFNDSGITVLSLDSVQHTLSNLTLNSFAADPGRCDAAVFAVPVPAP